MEHKDYYKIMGLAHDATASDVKTAYRRLARKYHPDLNKEPHAEEKFKELGEAYEALKDPQKRKVYDQYCAAREATPQYQATEDVGARYAQGSTSQAERDFFESLFGRAHFTENTYAGSDYHGSISISLEEAYNGTVKEINLSSLDPLQKSGQTIRVKIPAGVRDGQKIRMAGLGGPGIQGGANGSLYLTVHVLQHALFDVIGHDVYVTLPVTPWEVALGSIVGVPTLGGDVDLKIPAGSQGGQKLRLKNRGLRGKVSGSQYVILKIVTPQPVSDADKALYQSMAHAMPFNPRKNMGGKHER